MIRHAQGLPYHIRDCYQMPYLSAVCASVRESQFALGKNHAGTQYWGPRVGVFRVFLWDRKVSVRIEIDVFSSKRARILALNVRAMNM